MLLVEALLNVNSGEHDPLFLTSFPIIHASYLNLHSVLFIE